MHDDQRNFSKTLFPRWLRVKNPEQSGKFRNDCWNKIETSKHHDPYQPTQHLVYSFMVSGKGRMDSMPIKAYIIYLIKRHPQKRKVKQISITLDPC